MYEQNELKVLTFTLLKIYERKNYILHTKYVHKGNHIENCM